MKGIYLTLLLLASFSTLGKENLTPLTPEQLFSDPEVSDFSMSPDGKYMAVVIPQEDTDLVSITDLDAKKITYSFRMGKNKYMGRFRWANNTRLLIEPAIKVAFRDQKYLTQKLQAINFDGSQNRLLYGYRVDLTKSAKNKRFNDYFHIESILPNDDEHILLSTQADWKSSSTKQLQKLNIYKGKLYPRERSSVSNAYFTVDHDGNPVAQTGTSSEDEYIFEYKNKKDEWQKFPDADNYILLSNGFDSNIYLSKMASENNKEEILQFNRFDQSINTLATLNGNEVTDWLRSFSGRMYAYRTDDKYPKLSFLDPKSTKAQFHQQLKQAFKGKYARVIQSSRDYKRRIIAVTGDNEPGLYYLYKDNQLMQIAKVRASIDRKQFTSMNPIEFKARDGLLINGYISYPKNQESTAPMVVMVHGGPFGVRDYWGFNSKVQLLTSHGYTVLQVNYRGSGYYGRKFKESGYQQYGLKMQDDLTDATLWAIKNGVADKNKICIYGGSYGGYAALMGVVKEPDLYRCAIGFAGVYDLPLLFETGDIQEANWGDAWLEKSMGTDMKVLAENSPARLTHKIKAKLFIAHGEQDKRVPFEHYEKLTEALDKNKKPYESMIFEGEAHGIANTKNRIKFYKKMLSFLDEVFEE